MSADRDWEDLLARHLGGQATAADIAHLNERLRTDASARSDFAEMLNLDSALAAMAAAEQPVARTGPYRPHKFSLPKMAALAAILAVMTTAAWLWLKPVTPYAIVLSSAGSGLTEGVALHGESQELIAGSVELLTQRGARVVIEAPASFRFESAQRLHLLHGRTSADVPPAAKGFTIITPKGDAVDLGTKFGVDVTTQGTAEIHVFQGEVIAQPKGTRQQQSLRNGEAVNLQPGSGAARELRPAAFIRSDEMASLSAGLTAGQKARSENALAALRNDPALIALLDFESKETLPGTFRLVQGRWPGSRAPEFVDIGDHMKLTAGADRAWPQLTLAAWVRLDRLGEPYQSLYHTDGWQEDKPGQVHWMLNRDTTMRLALRHNIQASGNRDYDAESDSRTPVLPERGRWVHLATVYDATARTMRYYLNGEFDKEAKLSLANPARLGSAQIGNWNQKDRKLSGRVDEFLLLGRAMADSEIHALYSAGNPYR